MESNHASIDKGDYNTYYSYYAHAAYAIKKLKDIVAADTNTDLQNALPHLIKALSNLDEAEQPLKDAKNNQNKRRFDAVKGIKPWWLDERGRK